jgi:membrane fusion protein
VFEENLFRPEAVQKQYGNGMGGISVATPPSRWLFVVLAGLLGMVTLLFLTLGRYTRRESVTGQIVPAAGAINVNALNAGTVTGVFVRDGQEVRAGDPLVEISGDQGSAALGDTRVLIGQQLAGQLKRFEEDLQIQQLLVKQRIAALVDKIAILRLQRRKIESQLTIHQQQIDNAKELLERMQPLSSKGYVSTFQIQQQKSAVIDAESQHMNLAREQLDVYQKLADAEQQLVTVPLESERQKNDIERKLGDIKQSIAQNEMQRAILLRAQTDGIVSAVLLKPGQMVSTMQPLLSLLPSSSALQARLLVPSRAIGFIAPGSQVVLRYQAFPYQKFGHHFGRIVDISRNALTQSEINAVMGQSLQEDHGPLYRVHVELERQHVLAQGVVEQLKPGMEVDADILMEHRSLIEWAFEPLYGIRHRFLGDVGGTSG